MSRGWILLLSIVAVGLLAAVILYDALRERDGGFDPAPPGPPPEAPEPEPEPPPPRRPLGITGRLMGPGATALAGWKITCGEQSAVTDAEGRFELEPVLRPRWGEVRLSLGGKELGVWPRALAGDPEPPPPPAVAAPAVEAVRDDPTVAAGAAPGTPDPAGTSDPAAADTAGPTTQPTTEPSTQPTTEPIAEPIPEPIPDLATAAPLDGEAAFLPERPDRLRWTILLTADAMTAAGPSALGPSDCLRIEEAFAEEWGNGARVRLRGSARLPDGAHVQASLYFNGARFAGSMESAAVRDRRFLASLVCSRETQVFSGPYEARVSFDPVLEKPADVEAWRLAEPARDWDVESPEASLAIFIGDLREHEEADAASLAYYTRLRVSAAELHRQLKVRVAEAFAMARQVAPPERANELKTLRRVGRSLDARILGASRVEITHKELFDEAGQLNVAAWRKFLDEEWRPQVKALSAEHAEREQEKYAGLALALTSLLDALLDLSFGFSRFYVYPAFGLPPDERDFYPDEEEAGDLGRLETVVVEGLKRLERVGGE